MNNTDRSSGRSKQSGIAIVEFTITLPLLLFLMFAGAEVGRLLYQYNALTKAVENGARYLATQIPLARSDYPITTILSNAEQLIRYGSTSGDATALLPGTLNINIDRTAPAPTPIVVNASFTYQPMVFPDSLPGFGLWDDVLLARSFTAQVEMPILSEG